MMSGRLDRKIIIQQQTTTKNAYGETIISWSDLTPMWAEVKQQSAREAWEAGKVSEIEMMFRIRYRSDIDNTMRIVYDGVNYDITGVRELGRRDGLEIQAKVVT